MQRKVKPGKKKAEKATSLTRSLSARISPLAVSQRFVPGSFDLGGILKRKAIGNQLLVAPRKFCMLNKTSSMSGLIKTTLKTNSEKPFMIKEPKSQVSPERIIYINELRMKLREIKMENKQFKKDLDNKKHKKKLWTFIETFKTKLKSRIQQMS